MAVISSVINISVQQLGVAAAVGLIKELGEEVVGTTVKMEKLTNMMTVASGSTQKAAVEMANARDMADKYGLEITSLTESYAKYMAAGKNSTLTTAELRKSFEEMVGAAGKMGLSSNETEGVLRALEQMISKNKVSMEELRQQLGDRLPGALDVAAKSLGMTTSEMTKQIQQGNILASDLIPKMTAAYADFAGSGGPVDTTQAALNRLSNSWTELMAEFSDSDSIKMAIEGIQGLVDTTKDLIHNLKEVGGAWELVSEGARGVGRLVGMKDEPAKPRTTPLQTELEAKKETLENYRNHAVAGEDMTRRTENLRMLENEVEVLQKKVDEEKRIMEIRRQTYAQYKQEMELVGKIAEEEEEFTKKKRAAEERLSEIEKSSRTKEEKLRDEHKAKLEALNNIKTFDADQEHRKQEAIKKENDLYKEQLELLERKNAGSSIQARVAAIAGVESAGDDHAISPTGAKGKYQFTGGTKKFVEESLLGHSFDAFDPEQSRVAAEAYFKHLLKQFDGDFAKATIAYSANGSAGVRAAEKKAKAAGDEENWINYMPTVPGNLSPKAYLRGVEKREDNPNKSKNYGTEIAKNEEVAAEKARKLAEKLSKETEEMLADSKKATAAAIQDQTERSKAMLQIQIEAIEREQKEYEKGHGKSAATDKIFFDRKIAVTQKAYADIVQLQLAADKKIEDEQNRKLAEEKRKEETRLKIINDIQDKISNTEVRKYAGITNRLKTEYDRDLANLKRYLAEKRKEYEKNGGNVDDIDREGKELLIAREEKYVQDSKDLETRRWMDIADQVGLSTQNMASALVDMANGGKTTMRDFALSVVKEIEKMIAEYMILIAVKTIAGVATGGASSIGTAFTGALSSTSIGTGTTSFRAAGGIIDRTTEIGTAGGKTIAGEAGPEAIVPLSRGSDGKLGIASHGGKGGMNIGSINVTVQSNGRDGKQQGADIGNGIADALKRQMRDFVRTEIQDQFRPGNSMNRGKKI